jgi:hypothetical protein
LAQGRIERTAPRRPEVEDDDRLDLPRLIMRYDQFQVGRLFQLIRAVNEFASAPPASPPSQPRS